MTGIVRNGTTTAQQDLSVQLRSSAFPLPNRSELKSYAAGRYPAADYPVGVPTPLRRVIPPGGQERWSATLQPSMVGMSTFGVYPLAAQVINGVTGQIATGRTFLPFWPRRRLVATAPAEHRLDLAAHRPAVPGCLPGPVQQCPGRPAGARRPAGQAADRGHPLLGRRAPHLGHRPGACAECGHHDPPVRGRRVPRLRRCHVAAGQPGGPRLAERALPGHGRAAGLPDPVRGRRRRRAEPCRPRPRPDPGFRRPRDRPADPAAAAGQRRHRLAGRRAGRLERARQPRCQPHQDGGAGLQRDAAGRPAAELHPQRAGHGALGHRDAAERAARRQHDHADPALRGLVRPRRGLRHPAAIPRRDRHDRR